MRVQRSSRRWLIPNVALGVLLLTASPALPQAGPVQYGYDELGRLVVVADGAGNTAIYAYDAVGNLLSIQRIDPNQLGPVAITAITPTQGKVGSMVSIFGKGFGATPAQNTVSFNGGAAIVTSASPSALRVTVPSAAQDGPIGVTTPAGSATSAQSFRVIGPLAITPATLSLSAGTSVQFTATSPGGSTPAVNWAVNDVPGGNAGVGTISASGLYTPPAYVPQPILFTITATEQIDPTATGSTTATIVPRRLAAAAQGVSVKFGQPHVANSLQTSVSTVIGGTANSRSQASVSVVMGGHAIARSVQASVGVIVGGAPSATAAAPPVSVGVGPVIVSVSPAAGARGATGLTVTLTGAGFNDATDVTFLRANAPDTTITAVLTSVSPDGTQATLQVSIASGAATGARVVKIVTPTGTSTVVGTGTNVFTVQ